MWSENVIHKHEFAVTYLNLISQAHLKKWEFVDLFQNQTTQVYMFWFRMGWGGEGRGACASDKRVNADCSNGARMIGL